MSDEPDRSLVQSSTEYARTQTRYPNCGDHVPAIGRDAETTECPNCRMPVRV